MAKLKPMVMSLRLDPATVKRIDAASKTAQTWHKKEFPWWGEVTFTRSETIRALLEQGLDALSKAK